MSIACTGTGANVDIKKTTYKKLSKLLSTFEKKVGHNQTPSIISWSHNTDCHPPKKFTKDSRGHRIWQMQGLLTTKVVHKQDKLTAINRGHKLFTAFTPEERLVATAAVGSPSASTSGNTITVTYSYRWFWIPYTAPCNFAISVSWLLVMCFHSGVSLIDQSSSLAHVPIQ